MTDEERQKLCKELSRLNVYSDAPKRAADEIERLAEQLKKSQAKVRELEAELDDYL